MGLKEQRDVAKLQKEVDRLRQEMVETQKAISKMSNEVAMVLQSLPTIQKTVQTTIDKMFYDQLEIEIDYAVVEEALNKINGDKNG